MKRSEFIGQGHLLAIHKFVLFGRECSFYGKKDLFYQEYFDDLELLISLCEQNKVEDFEYWLEAYCEKYDTNNIFIEYKRNQKTTKY